MKHRWSYDIIAPFYDFDMGLNMPFDDVAGYLALLPPPPARLLEVGCGTGRLTLPLAGHGYSITAIDRSEPMLETLRNKLYPDHDINPMLMDAREIGLAGPFHTVLFGYSGFQYLLDDRDISMFCEQVKRLLKESGSLILDVFLHRIGSETSNYVLDYKRELEDGRVLSRHKQLSVNHDVNHIRREYRLTTGDEQMRYQTESRQRLYSADSLETKLEQQGFRLDTEIYDYLPHICSTECCHRFYTARFIPV